MQRKRIISLISCILSVSFIITGCSKEKTIVIDTNIEEESSSSMDITETTINLDMEELYFPLYFDGDEIYGTLGLSGGGGEPTDEYPIYGLFKNNLYNLDIDGNLKESNKAPANYSWEVRSASTKAVGREYFGKIEDKRVYYFDNKTAEKIHIGDHTTRWKATDDGMDIELLPETIPGEYADNAQIIEGNSDYAYIMECEETKNILVKLEIINLKDNKKYNYTGKDIGRIEEVVYSKITNKFYGMDWTGKLYSIELNGEEVKFVEEDNIDIKGLNYIRPDGMSVTNEGKIVILNTKGKGEVLSIVYNPKMKTTNYINKNPEDRLMVEAFFTENNKLVLCKYTENKQIEMFIAELKDDALKIYTKLDIPNKEGEYSLFSSAIIDEEGKKMLIGTQLYTPENNTVANVRYVYKLIEFN